MGKRSFALLLALVLTATLFSACTKGTTGQTETTAKAQTTFATDNDNFKLSYTQSDSLDPFAAKTQNNQVLADLVFESLFDLDGSYTAQPNLATGYEFTNSTTLKVIVPSGLTFSDKSALTVADVVYSFEQAKNPRLRQRFARDSLRHGRGQQHRGVYPAPPLPLRAKSADLPHCQGKCQRQVSHRQRALPLQIHPGRSGAGSQRDRRL